MTPIENLWTFEDVMQFLGVKRTWVYENAKAGKLPHVRIGNLLRFEPEVLREWVKKNRNDAPRAAVLPIGGRR